MLSEKTKLELNKLMLEQSKHDEQIRRKVENEPHWRVQRWFWVATVIVLVLAQILAFLSKQ